MNSFTDIATIALAVVAILATIAGVVAWFYRRGKEEQSFTESLRENTEANKEVAAELRDFRAETVKMLHALDTRVTVLETHTDTKTRVTVVEAAQRALEIPSE